MYSYREKRVLADVALWRFKMCISFVTGYNPTWLEFDMIIKESIKVQEIFKEPSSIKFVYTCTAVTISGFRPTNITRYKRIDSSFYAWSYFNKITHQQQCKRWGSTVVRTFLTVRHSGHSVIWKSLEAVDPEVKYTINYIITMIVSNSLFEYLETPISLFTVEVYECGWDYDECGLIVALLQCKTDYPSERVIIKTPTLNGSWVWFFWPDTTD